MLRTLKNTLGITLLLLAGALLAVWWYGRLSFQLSSYAGDDWTLQQLTIGASWHGLTLDQLQLRARALEVSGLGTIKNVAFHCRLPRINRQRFVCRDARFSVRDPRLDRPTFTGEVRYLFDSEDSFYTLKDIAVAGGQLDVSGYSGAKRWQTELHGRRWQANPLTQLLQPFLTLPAMSLAGSLDYRATLQGPEDDFDEASIDGQVAKLNLSTADGRLAAEKVAAGFTARLEKQQANIHASVDLSLKQGQVYADPVFLEITDKPLRLHASLLWDRQKAWLRLAPITLQHPGILTLQAAADVTLEPALTVQNARLQADAVPVKAFYETYARPFLLGSALDDLELSGRFDMDYRYHVRGGDQARLDIQGLHLDDRQKRFGLYDASGQLVWRETGSGDTSQLQWQGGHLYKVDIGAGSIKADMHGASFSLGQAMDLPVLDGRLYVRTLEVSHAGKPDMQWKFAGKLSPISMQALTHKLGWPLMSGTLSGEIPTINYANNVLELGGELRIDAFDGVTRVRNLRLESPFGVVPTLAADIELRNLDLETLTRTFSFGRIEGRLDGHIHKLLLQDWRPVYFDAALHTPPDDRSRHRISQKAVNNITRLSGGGLGNTLSRSALRFFEEFSYSRLGISCQLKDNVCQMDGVAPAREGYYLIKGGGLPRIEVIGYTRQVDWPVLVNRLKRITAETEAVVQ
jgi:hypothetical protein